MKYTLRTVQVLIWIIVALSVVSATSWFIVAWAVSGRPALTGPLVTLTVGCILTLLLVFVPIERPKTTSAVWKDLSTEDRAFLKELGLDELPPRESK